MSDTITLTGLVATDPHVVTPRDDLQITSFRLASNQRYFDRQSGQWVERDTNWYTVSSYRQLGRNAYRSLRKGDRIVVTGRLKVRSWERDGKRGTNVEVDADAIGHDLLWGTAVYTRTPRDDGMTMIEPSSGADPVDLESASAPGAGGEEASAGVVEEKETAATGSDLPF